MEAIVEPEPVAGAHPPDTCHGRRDDPATPHDRGGKTGQAMPGANLLELLFETSRIKEWIDSDLPRAVARQKRQNQEAPADAAHTLQKEG